MRANVEKLLDHIGTCPFGFIETLDKPIKLVTHRSYTSADIANWLKKLYEITDDITINNR